MKRTLLTATLVAAVAIGVTTAVDHATPDVDGDGSAVATLADRAMDDDSGSGRLLAARSDVWGELPDAPGDVVGWQWYRREGDHDGRR